MGSLTKNTILPVMALLIVILVTSTVHARRVYIETIQLYGNSSFGKNVLLSVISSKPSSLFHRSRFSVWVLKDDINKLKMFYRNEGFLAPEITYEVNNRKNGKRVTIIIKIIEGARVHIASLRIEENAVINESSLKYISSRNGEPLRSIILSADALILQDSIAAKGFLRGTVYPQIVIDSVNLKAFVLFHVLSGPRIRVGEIQIKGLSSVNRVVVKRELTFKANDVLTSYKKTDSEQNLYKTRVFNFLSINPLTGDSADTLKPVDSIVPVVINVNEAKFLTVEANVGYNAYEKFTVSQATTYTNLFRRAHAAALDVYASGIKQGVALIYSIPWIFNFPLNVNLSIYYERQGNLFFTIPLAYTGLFDGFTIAVGQERSRYFSYGIDFTWENTIKLHVFSPDTVPGEVPLQNTRSVTANLVFDRRDNVFNPMNGLVNKVSATIAGFGGGVNKFVKVSNDLRGYFSIGSSVTLSSAVTMGYGFPYGSSVALPVQEQFYAGGPRSVRGYDLNSLITNTAGDPVGGEVLLVLHILEAQFPLYRILKGAVFTDAGYVWSKPGDVNLRDVKFTAGPSLRLASPLGIVRFDVGFKLDQLKQKWPFRMYLDFGRAF
jgi:outer membrane protein insertion porin family